MKKENTEFGSTEEQRAIRRDILTLTNDQEQLRKKRNRRDSRINGTIMGLYVVLTVVGIITGAWTGVLTNVALAMWLGLVWVLERQINDQRYIINMQHGLHELERKELDKVVDALPKKPVTKKGKKNASTNA